MPGPPPNTPDSPAAQTVGPDRSSVSADRVYHAVTIAAILLVLGSLWVF
ncbi:MAG: hypothetical protein WBE76_09775 [Terracidiphilus sp.]